MSNARELTARLAELLRRERAAMADFLVALADFDRRRLWLDLGYASLFHYLHRELGLSKGAAHYRKTAADLVQRFPEIVEPLSDGRLCVTSVVHLAKVLTPENRVEMLPRFFHRSRREAAEVAAAIRPAEAAPRRDVVTPVRAAAPVAGTTSAGAVPGAMKQAVPALAGRAVQPAEPPVDPAQATVQLAEPRVDPAQAAVQPPELRIDSAQVDSAAGTSNARPLGAPAPHAYPPPRPAPLDTAEPVTAELSRLHVTVSRRFLAKLEAARAALSHARPGPRRRSSGRRGWTSSSPSMRRRRASSRSRATRPRPRRQTTCRPT
jgi:hypothetical protein